MYIALSLIGTFCSSFFATILYYTSQPTCMLKSPFNQRLVIMHVPILFLLSVTLTLYSAARVVYTLYSKKKTRKY